MNIKDNDIENIDNSEISINHKSLNDLKIEFKNSESYKDLHSVMEPLCKELVDNMYSNSLQCSITKSISPLKSAIDINTSHIQFPFVSHINTKIITEEQSSIIKNNLQGMLNTINNDLQDAFNDTINNNSIIHGNDFMDKIQNSLPKDYFVKEFKKIIDVKEDYIDNIYPESLKKTMKDISESMLKSSKDNNSNHIDIQDICENMHQKNLQKNLSISLIINNKLIEFIINEIEEQKEFRKYVTDFINKQEN